MDGLAPSENIPNRRRDRTHVPKKISAARHRLRFRCGSDMPRCYCSPTSSRLWIKFCRFPSADLCVSNRTNQYRISSKDQACFINLSIGARCFPAAAWGWDRWRSPSCLQNAGALVQSPSAKAGLRGPNPLAPKPAQFPSRVKHVIHLFMNGGPSHVDTFDPKPLLQKYAGKEAAHRQSPHRTPHRSRVSFALQVPEIRRERHRGQRTLSARRRSASDDLAVIRSMHADVPNHEPSLLLMNCGEARLIRPSLGSWLTYGLGSENQNLPAFIAMCPGGYPIQESQNWQSGFLPGIYQGTYIDTKHTEIDKLIAHIKNDRVAKGRPTPAVGFAVGPQRSAIKTSGRTIPNSMPAFNPSSWPTACSKRRPKRLMSPGNPSTFKTCTAPAPRPGKF